jgi:hypothetical protein
MIRWCRAAMAALSGAIALAHVSLREPTHVFLHFDVELPVVRSIAE